MFSHGSYAWLHRLLRHSIVASPLAVLRLRSDFFRPRPAYGSPCFAMLLLLRSTCDSRAGQFADSREFPSIPTTVFWQVIVVKWFERLAIIDWFEDCQSVDSFIYAMDFWRDDIWSRFGIYLSNNEPRSAFSGVATLTYIWNEAEFFAKLRFQDITK